MFTENEKRPTWQYLALTFGIAWLAEAIIILGEQLGILTGDAGKIVASLIIILVAAPAPAYVVLFLLKKDKQEVKFKDFIKRIFHTDNVKRTVLITLVYFAVLLLITRMISFKFVEYPWYYVLLIPLIMVVMIYGGGLEELGWRGFLQPSLEKKLPFVVAVLITASVWAVWHIPLWFIQAAPQSTFNFLSFWLSCVVDSFIYAAAYKLTKCVFTCVLIHAWLNLLGGIFVGSRLTGFPNMQVIIIYIIEIIVSIIIVALVDRKYKDKKTLAR